MKTTNRTLISIGIVCIALTDSGGGATMAALQSIAMAFPNVPATTIQLISTVPQLLLALIPLLYAKLLDGGIRKRTLMYIGSICFVLGGILPVFMHGSVYTILIARAIFGIGNGFLMPISVDLVIDFFEGEKRAKMQGFVQFFIGVSGILFQFLGGFLCGINWTYTFLSYGVAAIFCIISLILVPEPDRKGKIANQEGIADVKGRAKVTGGVYAITVLFGLFMMFWMTLPTNSAMVVIGEGLAAPAIFGLLTTAMPICNAIFGFSFGFIFSKIKFATFPIACLMCALGLYLGYSLHSLGMAVLSFALLGGSAGLMMPSVLTKVTGMVPYSAGAAAIAANYFFMGVLQFLQPIIFKFFGASGVGRPAMLIAAICVIVIGVLMIFVNKMTPAYEASKDIVA